MGGWNYNIGLPGWRDMGLPDYTYISTITKFADGQWSMFGDLLAGPAREKPSAIAAGNNEFMIFGGSGNS